MQVKIGLYTQTLLIYCCEDAEVQTITNTKFMKSYKDGWLTVYTNALISYTLLALLVPRLLSILYSMQKNENKWANGNFVGAWEQGKL